MPPIVAAVACGQCPRTFDTDQGLRVHVARSHRAAPATPKPKARPKLDSSSVAAAIAALDDYDPWLVVIGTATIDGLRAETAVVSTKNDAAQVGELLRRLGHKPLMFRVGDG